MEKFTCYDGEVDSSGPGKAFKVTPKAWNAESKAGSKKQISISVKWEQNTPEPQLVSMSINGIPYTCKANPEPSEEPSVPSEPSEGPSVPSVPLEGPSVPSEGPSVPSGSDRGVFVPWPSKVLGLYILLADDDHDGFESEADWEPRLFEWQQQAANVLFFTFIHPVSMDVPPAFAKLAKTRGTGEPGAVPEDTVILFAIGGYAYSSKVRFF